MESDGADGATGAPAAADRPAMIVSTYPDRTAALRAARGAVGGGLAACANMTDVTSVYTWHGHMKEEPECLAVFKTTRRVRRVLARFIASTHPYDVPEVIEISLRSAGKPYARWLVDSTAAAAVKGRGRAGDADAPAPSAAARPDAG